MTKLGCNILLVLLFFCGLSGAESLVLYSPSNAQVTKGSLDIVEITVDDHTYTSNNDMTCLNSVQRVVVTKSHKGVLKLGQKIKLSRHISKDIPLLKGKNLIYVIAIPTDFFQTALRVILKSLKRPIFLLAVRLQHLNCIRVGR